MKSIPFAFVLVSMISTQLTMGSAYARSGAEDICRQSTPSEEVTCLQADLNDRKVKLNRTQGELDAFNESLAHAQKTIWLKRAAYAVTVTVGVYTGIRGGIGIPKAAAPEGLAIDFIKLFTGVALTAGGGVTLYFTEENFSRAKDKVAQKQKEIDELKADQAQEQSLINELRAKL